METQTKTKVATAVYLPNNSEYYLSYLLSKMSTTGTHDRSALQIDHLLFYETIPRKESPSEPTMPPKKQSRAPYGASAELYDRAVEQGYTFVNIPELPNFNEFKKASGIPALRPSDMYAFVAFLDMLFYCAKHGYDYFVFYETDCAFRDPLWWNNMLASYFEMKSEMDDPSTEVLYGTPVAWHPWSNGIKFSAAFTHFMWSVQTMTSFPVAVEGAHYGDSGSAIYVNGALAIYPVRLIMEFMQRPMSDLQYPRSHSVVPAQDLTGMADQYFQVLRRFVAFDMHIGKCLLTKFGLEHVFDHIYPSLETFSSCGCHHVSLADKLELVAKGAITGLPRNEKSPVQAVHHIKRSEVPLDFWT